MEWIKKHIGGIILVLILLAVTLGIWGIYKLWRSWSD